MSYIVILSKYLRIDRKDHITDTNTLIKKTGELLRQFEGLKPKRKEEAVELCVYSLILKYHLGCS